MHHGSQRPLYHFALSDGDQPHRFPAQSGIIGEIKVFAQQDITANFTGIFTKQVNGGGEDDDEYDLCNHYACIGISKYSFIGTKL